MKSLVRPAPVAAEAASRGKTDWYLAAGVLALHWALLFDGLRVDWSTNPQYNYGWVVPLLGLALLWRRWNFRPAPDWPTQPGVIGLAAGCLLFALLPIRLIQEANPEWRLILWLHALQTAALSLCAVSYLGGGAWVKHFAFPIGFLLISVPWPTGLETVVIQSLMRFVALGTVEVLDLLNTPAVAHGNVIEIASGIVGVDEACSGVRSLQTSLLVSLFVGELHQFGRARRWLLLAGGFLLAILANIGRATFLVWAAWAHGFAKMHVWHDGAGVAVVFVVLAGLWGLALWLRPRTAVPEPKGFAPPLRAFPRRWLFAVAGWLVAVEAVTAVWYRAHEGDLVENPHWSVAWPTNEVHFGDLEIGETALAMLRCTEARGAGWQDANGNRWKLFFLRWDPGRNSAQLARSHRPEICLQGIGLKLVSQPGVYPMNATGGLTLPFRQYLFENAGRPLHIFYCAWENRARGTPQTLTEDLSHRSRLQAVLAGKRHLGQQTMEIAVSGPETPEAARELLQRNLPALVRN